MAAATRSVRSRIADNTAGGQEAFRPRLSRSRRRPGMVLVADPRGAVIAHAHALATIPRRRDAQARRAGRQSGTPPWTGRAPRGRARGCPCRVHQGHERVREQRSSAGWRAPRRPRNRALFTKMGFTPARDPGQTSTGDEDARVLASALTGADLEVPAVPSFNSRTSRPRRDPAARVLPSPSARCG